VNFWDWLVIVDYIYLLNLFSGKNVLSKILLAFPFDHVKKYSFDHDWSEENVKKKRRER